MTNGIIYSIKATGVMVHLPRWVCFMSTVKYCYMLQHNVTTVACTCIRYGVDGQVYLKQKTGFVAAPIKDKSGVQYVKGIVYTYQCTLH